MGVKTIWSSVQSYWEVGIPSKTKGQHCTGSTTSTWMCGIAFTLKMYASCLWLSDREPRPIRLEGCRWVILIHFPYFPQDILLAIRQSKGCPQISSTASRVLQSGEHPPWTLPRSTVSRGEDSPWQGRSCDSTSERKTWRGRGCL